MGDSEALSEVERAMNDQYTIKVRAILGAGCDDAKEVRILNVYVRWKSDGGRNWIEYEPDPRHAGLIGKSLNLESARVRRLHQSGKAGRGVDDISTAGRIAKEKIS